MPKGIFKNSEERIRKISSSMIGHKVSQITIEKMKKSHIGKHLLHSGSFQKGHKINVGRKQTEEHIRKRIEKLIGKKRSPFTEVWKKNMSKVKKGKPSHWKGKKRPEVSELNKKRKWSKKMKKIIKERTILAMANQEVRDKISNNCSGIKRSNETKQKMRIWHINNPNRIFKDTSIELKMEEELKRKNLNYEKQFPLCNIAIVDFYLPKYKTIIQCDGDYWHNLPKQKERDINQDKLLKENGFAIYRFWEHQINKNIEECINKLQDVL